MKTHSSLSFSEFAERNKDLSLISMLRENLRIRNKQERGENNNRDGLWEGGKNIPFPRYGVVSNLNGAGIEGGNIQR